MDRPKSCPHCFSYLADTSPPFDDNPRFRCECKFIEFSYYSTKETTILVAVFINIEDKSFRYLAESHKLNYTICDGITYFSSEDICDVYPTWEKFYETCKIINQSLLFQ